MVAAVAPASLDGEVSMWSPRIKVVIFDQPFEHPKIAVLTEYFNK